MIYVTITKVCGLRLFGYFLRLYTVPVVLSKRLVYEVEEGLVYEVLCTRLVQLYNCTPEYVLQ